MKNHLRKQIVALLQTIWNGIEYAVNNPQNAESMLCDCYSGIVSIGDSLQGSLSTMAYEKYGDRIRVMQEMLEQLNSHIQNSMDFSVIARELEIEFELLRQMLGNESESKLEIVFMPYKASMWDSLESIWIAANADPQCEAIVMPIPYYDRKPDRSFGEFHYEGDLFPEGIPIVHYSKYDLASECPDVIYIHNPYDHCNYVTSVDPKYYSFELKKYTDMLVYVPYYFTGNEMSDFHFDLSAYHHMDKMIVQSEKVKKQMSAILPEAKLLALGSPKADRMLTLTKQVQMPEEWRQLAAGRKLIFYNVSIAGMLTSTQAALNKIRNVMEIFRNRNDAVLLWRPHPLIKTTLQSMRPLYYRQYIEIEKEFLEKRLGILDLTPDVNKSVALADAYIGEASSSVVHLFGVTGKPIFITDLHIRPQTNKNEASYAHFLDCTVDGGKLWFVSAEHNVLCSMDLESGKTEIHGRIPGEFKTPHQFCDIRIIGHKIFLIPLNSSEIRVFDLMKRCFTSLHFKEPIAGNNFDRAIHYKNFLFLKPCAYSAVIRLNVHTEEIKYYGDCVNAFSGISENSPRLMWGVHKQANKLLMASAYDNRVLEFDMDNGKYKIHRIPTELNGCFSMAFDGESYWMTPNGGSPRIVKWNYKTGETTEYADFPDGFQILPNPSINYESVQKVRAFGCIVYCDEYLLVFPVAANMILKVDVKTGLMSAFKLDIPYRECDWRNQYYLSESNYYFAKRIDDGHVIALSAHDDLLLMINIKDEMAKVLPCRISADELDAYKSSLHFGAFDKGTPYASSENRFDWTLGGFLDCCVGWSHDDSEKEIRIYSEIVCNTDGSCGKKSHEAIKRCLL